VNQGGGDSMQGEKFTDLDLVGSPKAESGVGLQREVGVRNLNRSSLGTITAVLLRKPPVSKLSIVLDTGMN